MIYKHDFEFIVLLINDYIATLPASSKLAVAEKAQVSVANIERALQIATDHAQTDKQAE